LICCFFIGGSTEFDPHAVKAKGNQDLLLWLTMGLQPNIGFEVHIRAPGSDQGK
jgi:hypothetical protein